MQKKICIVCGARPQFIKLAPVLHELAAYPDLDVVMVHTGQHYDNNLSADFFSELNIQAPKYNLGIGSGNAGEQYSWIISKLSPILTAECPDMVVVVGDTNSTGAAALCAAFHQLPVAHIEAGLREYDLRIPEEINKRVTDSVASLFFCPTQTAVDILKREGKAGKVVLCGDPGLDLIFHHPENVAAAEQILSELNLEPGAYYFATCHRQINTEVRENLASILRAFSLLDKPVIFPVHPRTREAIINFSLESFLTSNNIRFIDPIGFWLTQALIKNAAKVLTDSGGLVKEAYFHNVYVVILDTQTEWVEVIKEGRGCITGPDIDKIKSAVSYTISQTANAMSLGNGKASKKIAKGINDFFK